MPSRTIEEERKLAARMIDAGVWLATGESFLSEVPGWFRITFTVPEEDFVFGFERYVFPSLIGNEWGKERRANVCFILG